MFRTWPSIAIGLFFSEVDPKKIPMGFSFERKGPRIWAPHFRTFHMFNAFPYMW